MKKHGFIKVGNLVPKLKVANVDYNVKEIVRNIKENKDLDILVTPELSLTGYTCGDLFLQDILIEQAIKGLEYILNNTKELKTYIVLGMPLIHENELFNVAVVINRGKIMGIVPKIHLPNNSEFYEKRWFSSGLNIQNNKICILNQEVIIDHKLIFQDISLKEICFGIEICEDLWTVNPPSNDLALNGATIILNLSASNEIVSKAEYRKSLVINQSARLISAYLYVSSSVNESSTDLVFSGHSLICENGTLLKEGERFNFESSVITSELDLKKIMNDRIKNKCFKSNNSSYTKIDINIIGNDKIERVYDEYPFVLKDLAKREERSNEILAIQSCGLAKRLLHTNCKKTVIGMSGGLDSTLAYLVITEAYKKLNYDLKNIVCVTMPGFGTTSRTYNNACGLVKEFGSTLLEVDIKEACLQHFKDIGIDLDNSITYENSQARERTQILMDIANKENALVIGTGDLSELALGWCTYNGDQMSMYAVNSSIPKTLVRYLVESVYIKTNSNYLKDILDTPISPELLPPDLHGNINQVTEDLVGPYVLHDYFLYHMLRYGATPSKIYLLAMNTFLNKFSKDDIMKWLKVFYKRFFNNQFKRSCIPDGPKVGSLSLSPRGDLRMPSDADVSIWLKDLK